MLETRAELSPLISKSNDRLKDLLFLDIALDSTVRTAIERGYEELNSAKPEVYPLVSISASVYHRYRLMVSRTSRGSWFALVSPIKYAPDDLFMYLQKIMYFITLVLENLALSWDDNEDLIYCLKVTDYATLYSNFVLNLTLAPRNIYSLLIFASGVQKDLYVA